MYKELTRQNLKEILNSVDRSPSSNDKTYERTCVFLLIFFTDKTPFVLAILKADTPGYAWRNQVALPGGHVDKKDRNPLEAAYRELEEEIGISRNQVEFIGSLGHFQTIQRKEIEAFMGFWKGHSKNIAYDPKEISKILELPLEKLLRTHLDKDFSGHIPNVAELLYPFEDGVVWGVTARIFHFFFEQLLMQMDETSIRNLR